MTLHAGQGMHWPSELTRLQRENARLRLALDESVALQSYYAVLLNEYDGGKRLVFADVEAWLQRIDTLAQKAAGKN